MKSNQELATKLYGTPKKKPQNGNLTKAPGGAGKEPQQQKPGSTTTAKPNNAAKAGRK